MLSLFLLLDAGSSASMQNFGQFAGDVSVPGCSEGIHVYHVASCRPGRHSC